MQLGIDVKGAKKRKDRQGRSRRSRRSGVLESESLERIWPCPGFSGFWVFGLPGCLAVWLLGVAESTLSGKVGGGLGQFCNGMVLEARERLDGWMGMTRLVPLFRLASCHVHM